MSGQASVPETPRPSRAYPLHRNWTREFNMKPMILLATVLALIATTANAKSVKKNAAPPADRYFDAAHGPDDPHSLWLAGDYICPDPDLTFRAPMKRQPYN